MSLIESTIFHGTKYSFDKSKLIFVGFSENGLNLVFETAEVEITITDMKDRERQYKDIINVWKSYKGDLF